MYSPIPHEHTSPINHNSLNPFSPFHKQKSNYYNNRRKDIKNFNSPIQTKPNNYKSTPKLSFLPTNTINYDTCSQRKKQLHINSSLYLSQDVILKKDLSSNKIKAKINYEEENVKLKKENDLLKKENNRLKKEINFQDRSKENKNNKHDEINIYKQLEKTKNEIMKYEQNKENLTAEITRYKKEIQKLMEDNIKLKSINQEQSLLITHSPNKSVFTHHHCFIMKKESSFSYTPSIKQNSIKNNMMSISNSSGTENLFNTLEKDNCALSEQLLTLESQLDIYMKSKSRISNDKENNYITSSIHKETNTDRSHSNISINESEICSLLYAFYSKIASLFGKKIIEIDLIAINKKLFIISTSSILTEIKSYQLLLQNTSDTINNRI